MQVEKENVLTKAARSRAARLAFVGVPGTSSQVGNEIPTPAVEVLFSVRGECRTRWWY